MRILSALVLALCLAACNRGIQTKEAVRQGVMDHLKARNMSGNMNVDVTSVQFNGNRAEATVSVVPKGGSTEQGMSIGYQLEQQGKKWVVVGRKDAGGMPHGGAMPAAGAMPGAENPHGSEMPASGAENPHGSGKMPSPEDLPPAGKKK
jgi:hypothetical protein